MHDKFLVHAVLLTSSNMPRSHKQSKRVPLARKYAIHKKVRVLSGVAVDNDALREES